MPTLPARSKLTPRALVATARRRVRPHLVAVVQTAVAGIAVASVLVFLLGSGPWQIGLLVILAMVAALVFRGGELLVNEAAISAILIASFEPTTSGFSADRILEGVIGGGVGLAVASLLLPPARGMDDDVDALEETISIAAETARFSPARRGGLVHVQRYELTMPQLDYAVRNTRVLARYAARQARLGEHAPQLAAAVPQLASAIW